MNAKEKQSVAAKIYREEKSAAHSIAKAEARALYILRVKELKDAAWLKYSEAVRQKDDPVAPVAPDFRQMTHQEILDSMEEYDNTED